MKWQSKEFSFDTDRNIIIAFQWESTCDLLSGKTIKSNFAHKFCFLNFYVLSLFSNFSPKSGKMCAKDVQIGKQQRGSIELKGVLFLFVCLFVFFEKLNKALGRLAKGKRKMTQINKK